MITTDRLHPPRIKCVLTYQSPASHTTRNAPFAAPSRESLSKALNPLTASYPTSLQRYVNDDPVAQLPARSTTPRRVTAAMSVIASSMRIAADEEARAEVDVLNSRLEKTTQLTKKIQACLGRLDESGKSVRDVTGPLGGETKRLQTLNHS